MPRDTGESDVRGGDLGGPGARPPAGRLRSGVLVVDKPVGPTSFGVVKAVRRLLGVRKAGHTGTLDPLATGVLPVCFGEATKVAGLLLAGDKAYDATALLGVSTDTQDVTGTVLSRADPSAVTRAAVEEVLRALVGTLQQAPPAYSAVRINGRRAHELARAGEPVALPPREVHVTAARLVRWDPPRVQIHVACGKGTYVRALAAELGERLGCGAALEALRRVRSGPFGLEQSVPLDEVQGRLARGDLPVLSIEDALAGLPAAEVSAGDMARLSQGQPASGAAPWPPDTPLRLRCDGRLFGLGQVRQGRLWPTRIFGGGADERR